MTKRNNVTMDDINVNSSFSELFEDANDVSSCVIISPVNNSNSLSKPSKSSSKICTSSPASSTSSSSSSSSSSYRRTMSATVGSSNLNASEQQYQKQNSSSIYCRICHEDENSEELADPCKCAGSLGQVHVSCLEKWLSTSNTDRCEICKYPFTIQRKKKSISQSITEWWHTKSVHGPRGLTGDAICLTVLTPLCLAATYLCAVGATAYSRLGYWEGAGLTVLCSLLIGTYFLWLIITVRHHYKIWRQWRRHNQEVVLLVKHKNEQPETSDGGVNQLLTKSPFRRQDRNNNRNMSEPSLLSSNYLFGVSFGHHEDPTYTVHQQTSFV